MSQPQVKLYWAPGSCSVIPQFLLDRSGLVYEEAKVNLRDPAARADYVKNVSPKGQVPALIVDGELITEAPAVQTAIAQLAPDAHFFGRTPLEAVRVYEWINYLSGAVHSGAFGMLFQPARWTSDDSEAGLAAVKAKGVEKVLGHLQTINDKLVGKKYAVGEGFTGVDGYLVCFANWSAVFGIDMGAYPEYSRVVAGLMEDPKVQETLAKQQQK